MRTPATVLALAFLVACDKTVPTPPGTTLIDLPEITKLSVTSWTLGAPKGAMTKVAKTYRYEPGPLGSNVRFKVSFEHGLVAFIGAPKPDKPESIEAVRAIKIEVVANTAWAMTATCENDLAVPLAINPDGTSAYPKDVWARCRVVMKRKNGDITVAPAVDIHAGGKVDVQTLGQDQHVVEE
jgi:hypothetical protein